MTKIQVPEALIDAAMANGFYPGRYSSPGDRDAVKRIIAAALQHLSQHPIVPTDEQHKAIIAKWNSECRVDQGYKAFVEEWGRRMFLAEPEVPEEVKDLLSPTCQNLWEPSKKEYDAAVLEAFRRGRSKE